MPLQRMCVIKGRPISTVEAGEPTPHFQILLNACGVSFRIAVNARSFDGSAVQYLRKDITGTELVKNMKQYIKRDGIYTYEELLKRTKDPCVLLPDYLRSGLLGVSDIFKDVAYSIPGENNDLNEFYNEFIEPLKAYGKSRLYAFGQVWGPDTSADEYFGFLPGAGIHDIHMNQGNPITGNHEKDNGVHQDGMLIVEYPEKKSADKVVQVEKWEALFLKFSSQAMCTDDNSGNPKQE
jgi:uncharacterized protein YukJ